MDATLSVTEDEIRAEFAAFDVLLKGPEVVDDKNAKTTPELAKHYGMSDEAMRKRINEAVATGTMEIVYVRRMRSNKRSQPVIAYRVVKDLSI